MDIINKNIQKIKEILEERQTSQVCFDDIIELLKDIQILDKAKTEALAEANKVIEYYQKTFPSMRKYLYVRSST